ncbi:MAG: FHA domain-containing protein [Aliidongia sp.]
MIPRILIKHVAGSQANRIDQFELDGTHELIIGREPPANVVFDGRRDDTVSRRHALIKIQRGNRLRFTVADLDSTNGVRVNGKDIAGEHDLVPGDIVELSPGGPAFSIAVEAEPVCLDRPEQPAKASGLDIELPPRPSQRQPAAGRCEQELRCRPETGARRHLCDGARGDRLGSRRLVVRA